VVKKVPNFKDFVNSVKNKSEALESMPSSTELAKKISGSLISAPINISHSQSKKFATQLTKISHSEDVLTELSNAIGKPKEMESEDEFVERAKSTLANILRTKLIK